MLAVGALVAALLVVAGGATVAGATTPGVGDYISAGNSHTCALTGTGDAQCWGHNLYGQAPPHVTGPFTAITAGGAHTCALTDDGNLQCWGHNVDGRAPATETGPFTTITAGGAHTCALTGTGDAQCWGHNLYGQAPPAGVTGPFTAITAGRFHTCALTGTGDAQCWGADYSLQAPMAGVTGPFTAITAGGAHTCALTGTGDAQCWGHNLYGQAPPAVTGPFTAITGGYYHTCALTDEGDARCWGNTRSGEAPPLGVPGPFGPVADTTPEVTAVTGPTVPVPLGADTSMEATFSPGDGPHTCTIGWGDDPATTTDGLIGPGDDTCSGSHAYTAAGVYAVTVTVIDTDGDPDTGTYEYVVVYDPAAGFVTGGGWIDSPAGAYTAAPDLTGKASFGFVSKYKKGATTPDGNTQFQFKAANLAFASTSYDWLVIAGPLAQYKGSGTINDTGDYGFLLTATDAQVNGGGDADTFRIKIWDTATDVVVYDNQSTTIGGGSIVIHTARKK